MSDVEEPTVIELNTGPLEIVHSSIMFEKLEEIDLSPREREITIALATGCTNREVAAIMGISAKTIDTHRAHAIRKLGARNNAGLTRYAIGVGWVDPRGALSASACALVGDAFANALVGIA